MTADTEEDLERLRAIGRIVALTLHTMIEHLEPGITTRELDEIGLAVLQKHGAQSAPRLAYNFPGANCISINDEAAHGIPGKRIIQPGDLVNIDVSAELNGYYSDTGASIPIPPVAAEIDRLCTYARSARDKAVQAAVAGRLVSAIGKAAENEAKRGGYNIIRSLHGHGIGRALHEDPRNVRNYYYRRENRRLEEGMVIAIEPFLTTGEGSIYEDDDGWTLKTIDRGLPAQYEHTIVVTSGEPVILTTLD